MDCVWGLKFLSSSPLHCWCLTLEYRVSFFPAALAASPLCPCPRNKSASSNPFFISWLCCCPSLLLHQQWNKADVTRLETLPALSRSSFRKRGKRRSEEKRGDVHSSDEPQSEFLSETIEAEFHGGPASLLSVQNVSKYSFRADYKNRSQQFRDF